MSSNGPIRNPPPIRQIRSICSSGAIRSSSSSQGLEPERPVAAVDEEPGAVGGEDHVPCPSPCRWRGRGRALLARLLARHHFEQPHDGRRIEEVHPDHAIGVGRRSVAIAVTSSEEVLVASTQSGRYTRSRGSRTGSRLSSSGSGAASITSSAGARSASLGAVSNRALAASAPRPRSAAPARARGRAGR